jgi:hypothetical protein
MNVKILMGPVNRVKAVHCTFELEGWLIRPGSFGHELYILVDIR